MRLFGERIEIFAPAHSVCVCVCALVHVRIFKNQEALLQFSELGIHLQMNRSIIVI